MQCNKQLKGTERPINLNSFISGLENYHIYSMLCHRLYIIVIIIYLYIYFKSSWFDQDALIVHLVKF